MNVSTPSIKELLSASYKTQKQAQKDLEKYGWKADPTLSRMDTKVFTDSEGKPIILHRGSTRVSDWLSNNTLLATGLEQYAPRFKYGKEITQKVKEKYGLPVTAVAHSLGGSIAEKSGADRVITYNKPITKYDIGKTIPKTQLDIRAQHDPVSVLSPFQFGENKITIPSPKDPLKSHSVNVLPENLFY